MKKRRVLLVAGVLTGFLLAIGGLLLIPGPIQGCYLNDLPVEGHNIVLFRNGNVYSCFERSGKALKIGTYTFSPGTGWIFELAKYERRILVKPRLLFATFRALDSGKTPATAPFLWRSLRFSEDRKLLARIEPEKNAKEVSPADGDSRRE